MEKAITLYHPYSRSNLDLSVYEFYGATLSLTYIHLSEDAAPLLSKWVSLTPDQDESPFVNHYRFYDGLLWRPLHDLNNGYVEPIKEQLFISMCHDGSINYIAEVNELGLLWEPDIDKYIMGLAEFINTPNISMYKASKSTLGWSHLREIQLDIIKKLQPMVCIGGVMWIPSYEAPGYMYHSPSQHLYEVIGWYPVGGDYRFFDFHDRKEAEAFFLEQLDHQQATQIANVHDWRGHNAFDPNTLATFIRGTSMEEVRERYRAVKQRLGARL